MGIANGHHRAASEDLREQPGLHHAGVLVLVEQDHGEPIAQVGANRWRAAHNLERESHLIGVLDESAARLRRREAFGEPGEHGQSAYGCGERKRLRTFEAVGRQFSERRELLAHGNNPFGVDDVLAQRVTEREHRLGHRVDALAEPGESLVVARHDDPAGQLPRRGLAKHRTVALATE